MRVDGEGERRCQTHPTLEVVDVKVEADLKRLDPSILDVEREPRRVEVLLAQGLVQDPARPRFVVALYDEAVVVDRIPDQQVLHTERLADAGEDALATRSQPLAARSRDAGARVGRAAISV